MNGSARERVSGAGVRFENHRRARRGVEVEGVQEVAGLGVAGSKGGQSVTGLDEPEDGSMVGNRVGNVAGFGVRRDDQQRHPRAQTEPIELWRGDVVVEPSEVVPGDKDDGGIPVGTLH